jgi:hypothetical protein
MWLPAIRRHFTSLSEGINALLPFYFLPPPPKRKGNAKYAPELQLTYFIL